MYDKPLIYYPLSVLMSAGIRDVMVISAPEYLPGFQRLLRDGSQLGISIQYAAQPRPEGLAQAFVIGRNFVGDDNVALVLGDNIFFGHGFQAILEEAATHGRGATVFSYRVTDPHRYGIVELDCRGRPIALEEKPEAPRSTLAVTGLYFYDNRVLDIAAGLRPSDRGELEITDVNRRYLETNQLRVRHLGRGFAWFDTGTHEAFMYAAEFVHAVERRQRMKIGCIEEVAFRKGYITAEQIETLARSFNNDYGRYLQSLAAEPASASVSAQGRLA